MRSGAIIMSAIMRSIAVAAIFYAVLLALSWVSLGSDPRHATAAVAEAFSSGDLTEYDMTLTDARIGAHQFNDCLILDQAIARSGTRAQMTVTPPNDFADRTTAVCRELKLSVTDGRHGPLNFYQNYIHGQTVLARALLEFLPVRAIRTLYQLIITALLFAGLALAMRQALRGGATVNVIFWICFFLAFARFFGFEYFAQSLGHGPADAVLLGYALWLETISFRAQSRPVDFVIPAAAFGALTAIFELLTGGLPLGIALTIAGVAMTERRDDRLKSSVLQAGTAFVTAMTAMVAIKIVLTEILFGRDAVASAGGQLIARLVGSAQFEPLPPPTVANIIQRVSRGLAEMMGGQPELLGMILLLTIAFGTVGTIRLRRSELRERAMLVAASNLVLVVWVAVFNHHFYVHAWFMTRIFAWTIATGFALFAMAVAARHPAALSDQAPIPAA
jgi:hypothetical protein